MKKLTGFIRKLWWFQIKGWYVSAIICGSIIGMTLGSPIIAYTLYAAGFFK